MVSDSQSTRGVRGRRMKFFWRLVVVLVCAFIGLFWFWFNEALHANDSEPIDGHLPLEKRVSIEAFQRDVEPHILSARQALFKDTGGAHPLSEGSGVSSWVLLDQKSWDLHSQETDGARPSVDVVYEVMREHVEPYGYVLAKDWTYKDGSYNLVWRDYNNGGAVYVSSLYDQVTNFHYESGERPSDGSMPDPRELIPNDSRDIAGYVSSSRPNINFLDRDAPEFPWLFFPASSHSFQSIEVFQRDVEPEILSFRDEVLGDSPYYVAPSPSEIRRRGGPPHFRVSA